MRYCSNGGKQCVKMLGTHDKFHDYNLQITQCLDFLHLQITEGYSNTSVVK